MRYWVNLFSVFIFSVFAIQNSNAASYDTCLKWVIGGVGVHCKSKPNQNIGAIIFFKKLNDAEWHYQSMNAKYPFEIILDGPGLLGPTVTDDGREACNKFCDTNAGDRTKTID